MAPDKLLTLKYEIDPIKPDPGGTPTSQVENILSQVIGFLTVVGVIYFAIQIILAGYSFLSSQGDKAKLEEARKRITNGILGLTIIVIAVGISALLANLLGIQDIFDINKMFQNMGL